MKHLTLLITIITLFTFKSNSQLIIYSKYQHISVIEKDSNNQNKKTFEKNTTDKVTILISTKLDSIIIIDDTEEAIGIYKVDTPKYLSQSENSKYYTKDDAYYFLVTWIDYRDSAVKNSEEEKNSTLYIWLDIFNRTVTSQKSYYNKNHNIYKTVYFTYYIDKIE